MMVIVQNMIIRVVTPGSLVGGYRRFRRNVFSTSPDFLGDYLNNVSKVVTILRGTGGLASLLSCFPFSLSHYIFIVSRLLLAYIMPIESC